MKFEIQKSSKRGVEFLERLGVFYHETGAKTTSTRTPACTLYTSTGTIPHVTNDLIRFLPQTPNILEVALSSLMGWKESLKALGNKPLDKIVPTKDFFTYLPIHDSARLQQDGFNEKTKIAMWSKKGKYFLTVDDFQNIALELGADMIECPYDDFNSPMPSKKRLRKSFEKSKSLVDLIFKDKDGKPKTNKKIEIVMPFIGNEDKDTRKFFLEHLVKSELQFKSMSYQGLEKDSETCELTDIQRYEQMIKGVYKELEKTDRQNVLKIMPLGGRPDKVLQSVELGFDLFSGCYPLLVTQKGEAMIFDYQMRPEKQMGQKKKISDGEESDDGGVSRKRKKLNTGESVAVQSEEVAKNKSEASIKLIEKRFTEDFSPLKAGCNCYTCKNFTRAYINHLLITKELSANTLLMMHNMSVYFAFFEEIRKSLDLDYFEDYKTFILNQF